MLREYTGYLGREESRTLDQLEQKNHTGGRAAKNRLEKY